MWGKDKLLFYNRNISFCVNKFDFPRFLFSLQEKQEFCVIYKMKTLLWKSLLNFFNIIN